RDVLGSATAARALGVEQRQLAAARVRADERELVLPVDDVHAEMRRREIRDRIPLVDPEGDVIQGIRLQAASLAIYDLAATARWSCAFVMRERPLMPRRFASL